MPEDESSPTSLGRPGRSKPKPYRPAQRADNKPDEDRPSPPAQGKGDKPIGRRTVLAILGLGALGIAFGERAQNGITSLLTPLRSSGLSNLVPGGGGFVLYTITGGYPAAPPDYHLTVDGMVDHPLHLTVADLQALPATHLDHTFQCVTGWVVPDVHWVGVRLTDLAKRAGAHAKASAFWFTSFDGLYTESLSMEQAEQSGAIVAYSMLGGPGDQGPRRPRALVRPRDVRLQVHQVAVAHHAGQPARARLLGAERVPGQCVDRRSPAFVVQAPTSNPPAPMTTKADDRGGLLARFDRVERAVHWTNAILFAVLVLTGAALYLTPLIALIGRRELVERIHLYAGIALPVPLILALSGSWGQALRRDLRRFNRWSEADRRWLRVMFQEQPRRRLSRGQLRTGKFNAGQKLNAAFTAGGGLVMLASGLLLRWYRPFPLSWRAGATFVHNWLALFFVVVIAGHILMALSDRDALKAMLFGRISRACARHAPAWLDEMDADATQDAPLVPAGGPQEAGDEARV